MTGITVARFFPKRADLRHGRGEAQPKAVRVTDDEVTQAEQTVADVVNDGDAVVRSPPVHSVYVVHHDAGVDPDAARCEGTSAPLARFRLEAKAA